MKDNCTDVQTTRPRELFSSKKWPVSWHNRTLKSFVLTAILGIHVTLLAIMAYCDGPTFDEVGHLPAGLSHIELYRFDLYRVNPPITRLIAAPAPFIAGAKTDWSSYDNSPGARSEFAVGKDFYQLNKNWRWLLALGRWSCIPLSVLGALICSYWASRLYGENAGLIALLLWCFSPTILTWSHTIMPDTAGAVFGALLFYKFRFWLDRPSWKSTFVTGLCFGLALASKGTWITLFAVLPVLLLMSLAIRGNHSIPFVRHASRLLIIFLIGIFVLNSVYGLEDSGKKLGELDLVSSTLTGNLPSRPNAEPRIGNRFGGTLVGEFPVPFPRNYVQGIDWIKWEFERGYDSYLRGQWKFRGWWYYYLYALAIKVPLGFWILALVAGAISITSIRTREELFDEIYLLFPAVFIIALVSSQTGFSHHMRYVLPTFPFMFIWASKIASLVSLAKPILTTVVLLSVLWFVSSSLSVFPHSMGHFNELVGSKNGYLHLDHSSVDYGQDLHYVASWSANHPDAKPFFYSHSVPMIDPSLAGIESTEPISTNMLLSAMRKGDASSKLIPGYYAIATGRRHIYTYLNEFEPIDQIGYSTFVYFLDEDDISRVEEHKRGQAGY